MANDTYRINLADIIRSVIVVACLGGAWWAFHDRGVLEHNLSLSRQNEAVQRETIQGDQRYLSQVELMSNAIMYSLEVRRSEAEKYFDERNSNWTRLVDACTELRLRGHDNHACAGIEK